MKFTTGFLFAFFLSVSFSANAQFKLYEKGHHSYTKGKYAEAIAFFSEYLTKSTRDKTIDVDVFYLRALSYYKLNRFQEAVPDFEETVLRGHDNRGNIYWFMAKSYASFDDEESLNSYNNAIRELAANRDAHLKLLYERGKLHRKLGNNAAAIEDFQKGLLLNPSGSEFRKELDDLKAAYVAEPKTDAVASTTSPVTETANPSRQSNTSKPNDKSPAKNNTKSEPAAATPEPAKAEPAPANPLAEFYKNEKRYALVIGVSNYNKSIGVLKNPVNDATDIARELEDSHFDVTLLTNATYGQIRAALMRFKEKLDAGDPENTVGLFYFAGHGLSYEDENYLVPVDAQVQYEDDIPRYCFPIQRMVLNNMERSQTRMNIVILDACRNNPFPSVNRSLGGDGLREMKRARGTFIAYATAPGSVASDGNGRNGLYTQELLKALRKPGLTIEQVFKEVRANVLKLSGNKQNTWDSSNIVGEFHFKY